MGPVSAVEEALVCPVGCWTQVLQRLQCRGGTCSPRVDTFAQTKHEQPFLRWVGNVGKQGRICVQKDDLDGEIDLKSCVKVSEFDVEKNYGFQIQVRVCWRCSVEQERTCYPFTANGPPLRLPPFFVGPLS